MRPISRSAEGVDMAWSTAALANLAGTTVNAIRHYHHLRLLDVPERTPNGYKQYTIAHLTQLLQIRRLREIGVSLADMQRRDGQILASAQVLRALDAEHAAMIERSTAARADISEMLAHDARGDVPEGFAPVAARLSRSERALTLIFSQLYDAEGMQDIRELVGSSDDRDTTARLEALGADAGEDVRAALAEQLAVSIAEAYRAHPWMTDPTARLQRSTAFTGAALVETLWDIYNSAQRDVLSRANVRAREMLERERRADSASP